MSHSRKVVDQFIEENYADVDDAASCALCWQIVAWADRVSHAEDHLDALDAEDVDREIKERPTLREEAEP